ncbi:pilus assembly protein TadG-related protein [Actinacidiphila acididurans]|uniref:Putative Flp pilus-assembly TadG-like N-terminal domain-containing protein n=1 Tax=Actinacidiphila acididurans TaxID=2784346 RepID=A0ABS2TMB2_9ACTN|nr:pilus assembly protein TadG-related protein [Actinacidiphila acididurans]MBM9504480.1 hypothetical protein [Actinacidiphila acididurans]
MRTALRRDDGQTVGIYIVSISALFFLAFAYFAVGQAAVNRNSAQTAADAAALAAARAERDHIKDDLLAALNAGDLTELQHLLTLIGQDDGGAAQTAASNYAAANGATLQGSVQVNGNSFTVQVQANDSVGRSVVHGTEDIHSVATATAVVEPRCGGGVAKDGAHGLDITCDDGSLTLDPTAPGFTLQLSDFYAVHLTN